MPIDSAALNWVRGSSTIRHPKRYLAVNPRNQLFTCQITNFILDGSSVIGFEYNNESGTVSDCIGGMVVDVGDVSGGYEKGQARLRSIDNVGKNLYVGEITYPEIQCDIGDWLTVVEEFRPFQKKPRIVPEKTNDSEYYNSFTEYHDYDELYIDQNENIRPKANITADSSRSLVKAADFVVPGLTYRIVKLDSSTSVAFAPGATIDTVLWDVDDCTITIGSTSSTEITMQVPDTKVFRYISLTVTDTNGTSDTMYFPLWCFNDENLPLSNFQIRSEERGEGSSMEIYFQEDAQNFETIDIPANTLVYYWSDVHADPAGFIGRMMGWTLNEGTNLKKYKSDLSIKISNAHYWLSTLEGFGQEIRNTQHTDNETPASWGDVYGLTVDIATHYILREYTTALLICNFYPTGLTNPSPGEVFKSGTIWSQIVEMQKANEFAACNVNNMNYIRCYRHYSYFEQDERDVADIKVLLTPEDFTYDPGIQVEIDPTQRVAYVYGEGDSYGTHSTKLLKFYGSEAPGPASGYVSTKETTPYQRLPDSGEAQTVLNRLTGHHWKRLNNPFSRISIELVGNMDFFDYGDVAEVEYLYDNIRDISWTNEQFVINKINIAHSYERGQRGIVISIEVEKATLGFPGYAKDSDKDPDKTPTSNKVLITENGQRLLTENFDKSFESGGPTWALTDLGLDGNVVQFKQLHTAFNSNDYCGVIVTSTKIYTVENLFDETPTVTERFSFRAETIYRSLDISSGTEWFGVVISNYDDGTYKTYSDDLVTWQTESQIGSGTIYYTGSEYGSEWIYDPLLPISSPSGDFNVNSGCGNLFQDSFTASAGGLDKWWIRTTKWTANEAYTMTRFYIEYTGFFDSSDGVYIRLQTSHTGVLITEYFANGASSGSIEWTGSLVIPAGQYVEVRMQYAKTYFGDSSSSPYFCTATEWIVEGIGGDMPACSDSSAFESAPLNQSPGCFTSAIQINRTYTSAPYTGGSADGWEATDSSLTFARLDNSSNPPDIDPEDALAGDIHVPTVNNSDLETIVLHGKQSGDARQLIFVEWTGVTWRDISPTYSGESFGPWKSNGQVLSHPGAGWFTIVCVGSNIGFDTFGVWVTYDNGETWIPISSSITNPDYYTRAFWYSKDTYHLYLLGLNGNIGWCIDADAYNIEDKRGNIPELSATGEIIGLAEKYLLVDDE